MVAHVDRGEHRVVVGDDGKIDIATVYLDFAHPLECVVILAEITREGGRPEVDRHVALPVVCLDEHPNGPDARRRRLDDGTILLLRLDRDPDKQNYYCKN